LTYIIQTKHHPLKKSNKTKITPPNPKKFKAFSYFSRDLMNIVTYILAILVTFLSVKPGIDAFSLSGEIHQLCCSSSKCSPITEDEDSTHQHPTENNGMCNPFQICCASLLVGVRTLFPPTVQPDISTKQIFGYQSPKASQLIFDFWQPPRFV